MSTKTKAIQRLLTLLGFSAVATSCESMFQVMYGTPSAGYIFNVDVKDAHTNAPINGMRVSIIRRMAYYNTETGSYDNESIDTLAWKLTNGQGKATLSINDFPTSLHEIAADDIDGAGNGGHYSTASTEVVTEKDDYENPSKDGWFDGTATHNVTLKITKLGE